MSEKFEEFYFKKKNTKYRNNGVQVKFDVLTSQSDSSCQTEETPKVPDTEVSFRIKALSEFIVQQN